MRLSKTEKEKLKSSLLKLEKKYVRKYFMNVIKEETKFNPIKISDPLLFIKRLYLFCVYDLVGGKVEINKISTGYSNFCNFIEKLENNNKLRDYDLFFDSLELFINNNQNINRWRNNIPPVLKNTNLREVLSLTAFKGMGHKTAALFLRFLVKYTRFFTNTKNVNLIVPLDRVNARIIYECLDSSFPTKNFSLKSLIKLQKIAKDIMVEPENWIYLDNFWFYGHFYYDRIDDKAKGLRKKIQLNSFICEKEFKYIQRIKLPKHLILIKKYNV
ncbi:hypothetical protein GF327_08435 [Candidatus Woesearchaeota archaeon]|nr:hypothetical protein [Candidatus Woesearchaeota archaeon]